MYRSRLSSQVMGDLKHTPFPNLTCHRVRSLWEWSLRTALSWDPTVSADITAVGTTCSHGVYKKARVLMHSTHSWLISISKKGSLWTADRTGDTSSPPGLPPLHLKSYSTAITIEKLRESELFTLLDEQACSYKNNFLIENIRIKNIIKALFSYLIKVY